MAWNGLNQFVHLYISLCEKSSYSDFFWSVFFRIRTEYGPEKLRIRTFFTQYSWSEISESVVTSYYVEIQLFSALENKDSWKTSIPMRYDSFYCVCIPYLIWEDPANIYLFEVDSSNAKKRFELCSKLTIKTAKRRHWLHSVAFIVNFEYITHFSLVFLLLTLNK